MWARGTRGSMYGGGRGWVAGPCDLCLTNDIKGSEQTDSPENIIFPQLC